MLLLVDTVFQDPATKDSRGSMHKCGQVREEPETNRAGVGAVALDAGQRHFAWNPRLSGRSVAVSAFMYADGRRWNCQQHEHCPHEHWTAPLRWPCVCLCAVVHSSSRGKGSEPVCTVCVSSVQ